MDLTGITVEPLGRQHDRTTFHCGVEALDRYLKQQAKFVKELDTASEVVVYAKLPRGFLIPTPVGDYNPDWAIAFKEGVVKHVYFVAETKGSMSSMELRKIEETKIACVRKFFDQLNLKYAPENVKYDVVNSFDKLMELVK